ncbi:hypothetical protein GJ336_18360 [Escherichia coli]|nr:hypothetical protein [Escherichia coli]
MNKITGVLVDNHIFDIKNDMVNDYYFPNTLFPGATFKMVIDNDPANNGKVQWKCGSSLGSQSVAVSEDGTVTFPGVDEQCCDELFYITATDSSGQIISSYLFVVKSFFKYSEEVYRSVDDISQWIKSVGGVFPETLDVNSQYISGPSLCPITREVNAGLFQEWGCMSNSGWKLNKDTVPSCNIYTFNKERNSFIFLDDVGFTQNIGYYIAAQAVAFYGKSRV